jgi:uncharacterized protein with FMN-binding domain
MRRTTAAIFGTMLGTGLMIAAKMGTAIPGTDTMSDGSAAEIGSESSAEPSAASESSTTPVPAATSGQPAPTAAVTTVAPRPTAATTTRPPATGYKDGTFAGPAVTEKYGTIKVTLIVSGGRITNVTATYPTGGETGSINANAIPKLRQAVLNAQSASISTVSGATYTSNAYKTSLQGAITAAKA